MKPKRRPYEIIEKGFACERDALRYALNEREFADHVVCEEIREDLWVVASEYWPQHHKMLTPRGRRLLAYAETST